MQYCLAFAAVGRYDMSGLDKRWIWQDLPFVEGLIGNLLRWREKGRDHEKVGWVYPPCVPATQMVGK
jgi:hypothetical protein